MVTFTVTVAAGFWDTKRSWPPGCRPVILSTSLVTKNAGTLLVPARHADAVEEFLRTHPHVVAVERTASTNTDVS